MKPYDHKKIEKKWQQEWETSKIYEAQGNSDKPKFYSLIEFPFPSGDGMHTGHLRSNTAIDIISRKRRMEGFNVLYPIGWDSFGLPTENYAIKTGLTPRVVTKKNTDTFRKQLKSAGFSFDWSREINTSDPKYYKWTQWIFLQMYKKGLAYKKKMVINWCPKDKIGLANEEVIDGTCERCGTTVEKREKEQWMLAITKYADRLDKDLDDVNYSEKIKIQQRNWIGKSEGAEITFPVAHTNLTIFTTRPDTIFGATYMVVAPEHEIVQQLKSEITNWDEVEKYITSSKNKDEIERTAEGKEKTGVELKGIKAINSATKEEIPVFIADYVLVHYGTGAIMAVPAHDTRDNAFAQKYDLPIRQVIEPTYEQTTEPGKIRENELFDHREAIIAIVKHWSEDKYIALKWKQVAWGTFITGGIEKGQTPEDAARMELKEEIGYVNARFIKDFGVVHGKFYHVPKKTNRNAHAHVVYLELENDERIETADAEKNIHEVLWLSIDELKTFLTPDTHKHALKWLQGDTSVYTGEGTLANSGEFTRMETAEAKKKITKSVGGKMVTTYKLRDWVFSRQRYWGEPIPMVFCEQCAEKKGNGWVPVPEKDLPVKLPDVENYRPTDNGESPLAAITDWVNTTCPKCDGPAKRETDTMPNWAGSSWYYLRYIDPENDTAFASAEKLKYWSPVDWYNGGMEHTTLHLLYSRFWHKFLFDQGLVPTSEPYNKRTSHGLILAEGGEKMSKSKGNVVNPDSIIENFGADTLRMYEMFMGPFDQPVAWSMDGIVGPRRFLEKVWRMQEKVVEKLPFDAALESDLHKTMKKVSEDIEKMSFNTAVSSLMILANEMDKREKIAEAYYQHFLKLLAPFAPHITEELWSELGHETSIHISPWDKANESKIQVSEVKMVVQVNGKVRAEFMAQAGILEAEARTTALGLPEVDKWVSGKEVKRVVFVPGKLVNIVVHE